MNFPPMGRRGRALALATAFLLLSICTAHADEASDLFDRIRTLCENGEFAAAREEASALVKLRRTNAGSKPYQVEDAERLLNLISTVSKKSGAARAEMAEAWRLDRAVDELLKQRDGARADSLASRRLGILERHLPANNVAIGKCHCDLATGRMLQDDQPGGERHARAALAIYREGLGTDNPELIRPLNQLASSLTRQMKAHEAEPVAREAVAIARRFPEDPAKLVSALARLAAVYGDADLLEPCEKALQEALDVARDSNRDDLIATASSNKAALLEDIGRYSEAETLRREALAARRRSVGDQNPAVAWELTFLAEDLIRRGEYTQAESCAREALAIEAKTLPAVHSQVAYTLHSLAWSLGARGEALPAEALYARSLVMKQQTLGPEHPHVAYALEALALIALGRGDGRRAEMLCRDALAVKRKYSGEASNDVLRLELSLARAINAQGRSDEAIAMTGRVVEGRRALLGDSSTLTWETVVALGGMLSSTNRVRADSLFQRALAFADSTRNRSMAGQVLAYLGYLHFASRDYEAAGNYWERMLEDDIAHGVGSLWVLYVDAELGHLRRLQERDDEATAFLMEAAQAYDQVRSGAGSELIARAAVTSPYRDLAALALESSHYADAWVAVERSLARSLADLLRDTNAYELRDGDARADSLREEMVRLEGQWEALNVASPANDDTAGQLAVLQVRLAQAREAWYSLQAQMAKDDPVGWADIYALERVQQSLDSRTAIVGWLDVDMGLGEDARTELWSYVIRNNGPVTWVQGSSIGDDEGSRLQEQFRHALLSPDNAGEVSSLSRRLHDLRIAPIESELHDVAHLVVVPCPAMQGLPVEALIDTRGKLVGDRFAVSYAPSATVYAWLKEQSRAESSAGKRTALLVGDPVFSEEPQVASGATRNAEEMATLVRSLDANLVRAALAGSDSALARLPRLAATRAEVRAISALCRDPLLLLGNDASEQRLVELAEADSLRGFDIIHMATHALVDDKSPERSALVLSQVGLPDRYESVIADQRVYTGSVTVKDVIRNWRLDADLVTLSACETALGKKMGGEGYVGFQHAFLLAGARGLLLSLWKVDDRATALLMKRFYENWMGARRTRGASKPMSRVEALQEAKRWLRNHETADGEKPFSHPMYWSSFVLVGSVN